MKDLFSNRKLWLYLIKFGGVFCLLYYGTLAVIGLAAPGGHHLPFVENYLDYVSFIKVSLIKATGFILSVFDIPTHREPGYLIRITGGRGVYIAMSCVGFGVYSFWIAFVAANKGSFRKKALTIVGGVFALWFINTVRITLFLVAINKGWPMPLGLDHHTWFNIVAYALIFLMILGYDKTSGNKRHHQPKTSQPLPA